MPSASSTEFISEVASRPADKRATELVHETTSTSGRFNEEEEEDKVTVSDLQSVVTAEDSVRIARQYDLEVVVPYKLEMLHTTPDGYVTVGFLGLNLNYSSFEDNNHLL